MTKPILSNPVALRLPEELLADIELIAETCDRTRSWVIVRALRHYLANEGADILAVRRGRRQVQDNDVHDMDDVLREIDEIVRGTAA